MKITCAMGIDLYNACHKGEDPQAILCRLKGVERPDLLSAAELEELTQLSAAFNRAALTPKDVKDVRLEFTLGEHFVTLGRFSELDITLQALDMLEDFNPTDFERMPVLLGCIYAPVIKEIFKLEDPTAKIAAEASDAIREQVLFEDVFSVFDFFGTWKENFIKGSAPSFKLSMSSYRFMRRATKPIRLLIGRSLTPSQKTSRPIMRAIRNLGFTTSMLSAIVSRWFWLTIASLHKWWLKKRRR